MNDIRRFIIDDVDDKTGDVFIGAEQGSGIWSNDDDDEFVSCEASKIAVGVERWADGRHRRAKKFVDSVRIDDLDSFWRDGEGEEGVDVEAIDAR